MFWRILHVLPDVLTYWLDTVMRRWHGKFSAHVCSTQPSLLNLVGASSERIFMYDFMNDRTRLLVGYLSPSACFTTDATVINEDVDCSIMSQSSTPILIVWPQHPSISHCYQKKFREKTRSWNVTVQKYLDPNVHRRYRSIVGCLSYLVNMTRPDLPSNYSQLSKFVQLWERSV
jgi:hypothetical protein